MAGSAGSASFANIGAGVSGIGGGIASGFGALETLFGSSTSSSQSGTTKGTVTEQLEIDEEGIQKILQDILGGTQGLASIFSEEQVAGLYSGSVAAQASGDLLTKLAGEIAKLTAKKTQTADTTTTSKTEGGSDGLLGKIGL